MAISEAKRRGNDRYNAKCDNILLRPLKPIGDKIRSAAKNAGESLQGYIIDAVDMRLAYEELGEHEIDGKVLVNLMDWLRRHGHNSEEITECLSVLHSK